LVLLDPAERTARGEEMQKHLTGTDAHPADTLLRQSWRDFIYAEIWSRPALEPRARFLISIASAASSNGPTRALDNYVRGALKTQLLTLAELREAALHIAVYGGWSRGDELDASITRVANELHLVPVPLPPICAVPWEAATRVQSGIDEFDAVMGFPGPPPVTPYFEAGIDSFVFAEMWKRPGLDQRSRRWITLVGVSDSCAVTPIKTHFYAALSSGNCQAEELHEFVLQYAVHAGWPKASVIQAAVTEMIKNHSAGLPWNG
jgi:4-carboxymuconolactone decarboxylase